MHLVIVAAALFASPLQLKRTTEPFGEVIRVNAVSLGELPTPAAAPEPLPEVKPPAPVEVEPEDVPIREMTTKPEVEVKKPEPEKQERKPAETPVIEDNAASDQGEGEGTEVDAPSGGAISGARVANAGFDYPYWFTLIWNKINQNHRFAVAIDGKVYCDVTFVVIASGRIIETEVVNPSGIPAFDQSCILALERSSPLPPLPNDWLDEIVEITVTFTNYR